MNYKLYLKSKILPKIFLLILLNSFFKAQSVDFKDVTFDRISIEDGLSQITVHSIIQDSKGFLWFGTEDGLNRYDGYNFVVYRHDPNDTASISDNFIWTIMEDSEKNIWVGTNNGGVNKYEYKLNSFKRYSFKFENKISNIRAMMEDSDQNIWIGTDNQGLYKYYSELDSIKRIDFGKNSNLSIRSLLQDKKGNIWIGSNQNGLFKYNPNKLGFHNYTTNNSNLKSQSIWALEYDLDGNLWVGTYRAGLAKFYLDRNKFIDIGNNINSKMINKNITSLLDDEHNNLWICTEGGLSVYDKEKGQLRNFNHNPSDLRSLSNSLVRCIYKDNSNLIWIGTLGGGVNKVNLRKKFNQFNHNPSDGFSLSSNIIRAIEEDSKGNLWIGTLGSGINRFDRKKNRFYRINSAEVGLKSNVVTSILEDKNNNLWIGTWGGGLNRIRLSSNYSIIESEIFLHSAENMNSITNNIIQDIYEDSFGNLWIGTEEGLNRYDSPSGNFLRFKFNSTDTFSISDNRVQSRCILEDSFGSLWVGTWNGLNLLFRDGEIKRGDYKFIKFYKENGLSDNRIIALYEDIAETDSDEQTIWIGTIGGGLNRMIITKNDKGIVEYSIDHFMEKDGLPSNVIYGILGDKKGNLWLSTNNGISKFDVKNKRFKNFSVDDGLQSNQFFWGAFHKTSDDEFYFGGINGLNSFYPDKLVENKNVPPIYVTECSFETTDGISIISFKNIEKINSGEVIELPYNRYNIKFEFAALDFVTPSKNSYKSLFKDFEDTWSEESYSNTIQYSDVIEGEYQFRVIGSNNDGLWNDSGTSVNIIIETPFWKTWWFILLLSASILGTFLYIITNQVQNALAVERLRTKLAADLHDNIGSSLTEISILSEVITTRLTSADSEIKKYLDKISYKSRQLIDKMSDIVWLVNPQRDTLYDLILRLQDTYSDLLSDTEISFRCENLKSLEKVSLNMENRQHLFLIFKEAINNAVTHSDCTELLLNARVEGRTLSMQLKDNGKGFDTDSEKLGNGLKNIESRAEKIGGKLSIKSAIGIGTNVEYIGIIK